MTKKNKINSELQLMYSDLPFPEQLVLWGFRMWAKAYNQNVNLSQVLKEGFRIAGVPLAFGFLHSMLEVLSTASIRPIDIRCPDCSQVSIDEHCILGAIAAYQFEGDRANSDRYLQPWLPPAALRIIREPTLDFATALKRGKLLLHLRPLPVILVTEGREISVASMENQTLH